VAHLLVRYRKMAIRGFADIKVDVGRHLTVARTDDKKVIVNWLTDLLCARNSFLINRRKNKMNTRGLLVTILAVALNVAPQLVSSASAGGTYSATLISPRAGQVLYTGQKIVIEWKSTLPNIDLTGCERRFGCRWTAGEPLRHVLRPHWTRRLHRTFGLFQTRLPRQRFWTSALGVRAGTLRAMPLSAPGLL